MSVLPPDYILLCSECGNIGFAVNPMAAAGHHTRTFEGHVVAVYKRELLVRERKGER